MGKECDHPGCPKRAHYGVDGTRRAEFCAQHAHDGYVNVLGPRCAHPACSKRPTFGLPGKKVSRPMVFRGVGWLVLLASCVIPPNLRARGSTGVVDGWRASATTLLPRGTEIQTRRDTSFFRSPAAVSRALFPGRPFPSRPLGGTSDTAMVPCCRLHQW